MIKNELVEIRIVDVAYGGRGVGRLDGLVYFVENALLGELIECSVTKKKKNCVDAELVRVIEASPARIDHVCPLAEQCPGCCYQHVKYDAELEFKSKQLHALLERIGGCKDVGLTSVLPSAHEIGYRNKLTMHVQHQGEKILLGYISKDNKTVLDVPRCPLAVEPINELLAKVRNDEEQMKKFANDSSVVFRWTPGDGAVFWNSKADLPVEFVTEKTIVGDLSVPAKSFFQVNVYAVESLIRSVQEIIEKISPKNVVDLYCGIGLFAFAAAKSGVESVLGIERDIASVNTAKGNVEKLGVEGVKFSNGDIVENLESILACAGKAGTTVILDPPRRGMSRLVIDVLCKSEPADIIYISCAADTMSRDIKVLLGSGYEMGEVKIVDMFPRTQYFETIVHLKKNPTLFA